MKSAVFANIDTLEGTVSYLLNSMVYKKNKIEELTQRLLNQQKGKELMKTNQA